MDKHKVIIALTLIPLFCSVVSGAAGRRVGDEEIAVERELIGPGLYWAHIGLYGKSLREWIDRVDDAGMNYIRLILFSNSWEPFDTDSFFVRRPDGKYDLQWLDMDKVSRFWADCDYARGKGVVIHLDLMDQHVLRPEFQQAWQRSELAGENNSLSFPLRGVHYPGDSPEEVVYDAFDRMWQFPEGHEHGERRDAWHSALFTAWNVIVSGMGEGHIVGDGNELDSLMTSRVILDKVDYPVKSFGGAPLFSEVYFQDPRHMQRLLANPLFGKISYLCLHGVNTGNAKTLFERVKPLLDKYPKLRVLFSTDGTGSGPIRGRDGRPSFAELKELVTLCRKVAGKHFGGLADIKVLTLYDIDDLLSYWKSH